MKKSWWIGLAAAALAAFTAFQDVPNEARRTDIHTVTGTVRSYAPQGHVVIVGSDGSEHSFPLDAGARVVHVDITLVCERPKIGPHREAMRARTAEVLRLPLSRVNVKATTTERMGFLGREEGLAAQATATLERPA